MSRFHFSIGPVAFAFCMFTATANAVPVAAVPSLSVASVPSIIPSSQSIAGLLGAPVSEGKTQGAESGRTQAGSLPWATDGTSHGFWFDERELIRFIAAFERWEERREHERHSHGHDHDHGHDTGGIVVGGGSAGQAPAPTPLPAPLLLLGSGLGLIGLIARRRRERTAVPA